MLAVRNVLVLSGLVAALLLSGCTVSNSTDGQRVNGPGSLVYNGTGTGTETSEPLDCDGSGSVHITSNLGSGQVQFTVKDGSGRSVYSKTATSPGQLEESHPVSSAAGAWTVTAARNAQSQFGAPGAFSGQYAIHLDC